MLGCVHLNDGSRFPKPHKGPVPADTRPESEGVVMQRRALCIGVAAGLGYSPPEDGTSLSGLHMGPVHQCFSPLGELSARVGTSRCAE